MGTHSFQFCMDRLFIEKTGPAIKDDNAIFIDVNFRAAYDTTNQSMFRAIVINDQAGTVYV